MKRTEYEHKRQTYKDDEENYIISSFAIHYLHLVVSGYLNCE
jgi:hypothetical protein